MDIGSKLYCIDNENIKEDLSFDITDEGKIKINLKLKNNSSITEKVIVTFPNIDIIESKKIGYCFQRLQPAIGFENDKMRNLYGSEFPLQFINIYRENKGSFTFITEDLNSYEKYYWLEKNSQNHFLFGVDYTDFELEPFKEIQVPSVIIDAHVGDWHEGLIMFF